MKKIVISTWENELGTNYQSAFMNLWANLLEDFGYDVYYYDYMYYNAADFYKQCTEIGADIIIQWAERPIHPELIKFRGRTKVFLIHADINYRYDIWTKFYVPYIDGLITFDEGDSAGGVFEKAVRDGMDPNGFIKMRWAFNPASMKAKVRSYNEKDILLSFVGNFHANRTQRMQEFANNGVNVFHPKREETNYEQAKDVWSRSKYTICWTWNAPMTKQVIPARILEMTPHCVLMCEPSPGMERYFKKDEEYIEFDNVKEAVDRIKSIGEKEYMEIFNNCRRKIWKSMTALHEWNKILPQMDPDYKVKSDEEIAAILKAKYGDFYFE